MTSIAANGLSGVAEAPAGPVVKLGKHPVGPNYPTFIVAEIGATHGGRLEQAIRLIETAAQCGADAVKLQTVNPDYSYCQGSESYNIFSTLKFDFDSIARLKQIADTLGLTLFTTPGDFPSLHLALKIGFEIIKISSGLITNLPLVRAAAESGHAIIVSTGMTYLDEVGEVIRVAREAGAKNIAALHCTSIYPLGDSDVNLRAIGSMERALEVPVGFSDHTPDGLAAVAAVAAGARIVEKHLTLSDDLAGPERGVACEPNVFKAMVANIRRIEKMMGSARKEPVGVELQNRRLYRRSIMARRSIPKGKRIDHDDVGLMRGAQGQSGLAPALYDSIIGMFAARAIEMNEPILIGLLEEVHESHTND